MLSYFHNLKLNKIYYFFKKGNTLKTKQCEKCGWTNGSQSGVPGTPGNAGDACGCHSVRRTQDWHPVSGDLGCCASYRARRRPCNRLPAGPRGLLCQVWVPANSCLPSTSAKLPFIFFFFFNLFSPVNLFLFSFLHIYVFGCTGSSLWHVGSSPLTELWAPALGAQSLSHWTTGEIPHFYFLKFYWCTVDLQC